MKTQGRPHSRVSRDSVGDDLVEDPSSVYSRGGSRWTTHWRSWTWSRGVTRRVGTGGGATSTLDTWKNRHRNCRTIQHPGETYYNYY